MGFTSIILSESPATCRITGSDITTGELILPSTLTISGKSYTVTSIGDSAFSNKTDLTGSLTIPSSVTNIGRDAFLLCSGFTGSLIIPNSVKSIGQSAFGGCDGFTGSLTISNSVESIGNEAFAECFRFTGSLTIPNSVKSIGEAAFALCYGFKGSLTIPNSVKIIKTQTFTGCSGFTGSITIPSSVTSIGDYAFSGCTEFTGSLTIPSSVKSIGLESFARCSGLSGSITILSSVTSIGDSAFAELNNITRFYIYSQKPTEPGPFTFSGKPITAYHSSWSNISSYSGSSVTLAMTFTGVVISEAKSTCKITGSNITSGTLVLPSSVRINGKNYSVTSIGDYAFDSCKGFTGSLTIPSSVTSIGQEAFSGCTGFTGSLTIPSSVKSIAKNAFSGCKKFTGTLTIPTSVTSVGDLAFGGCTGLKDVKIYSKKYAKEPAKNTFASKKIFVFDKSWKNTKTYAGSSVVVSKSPKAPTTMPKPIRLPTLTPIKFLLPPNI